MKTRIHIAVALLAGLLLAGCGSGLKADEPGGEEPQKAVSYTHLTLPTTF